MSENRRRRPGNVPKKRNLDGCCWGLPRTYHGIVVPKFLNPSCQLESSWSKQLFVPVWSHKGLQNEMSGMRRRVCNAFSPQTEHETNESWAHVRGKWAGGDRRHSCKVGQPLELLAVVRRWLRNRCTRRLQIVIAHGRTPPTIRSAGQKYYVGWLKVGADASHNKGTVPHTYDRVPGHCRSTASFSDLSDCHKKGES